MASWNARVYEVLDRAYGAVEPLGLPLAAAAWVVVAASVVALAAVLVRTDLRGAWAPALGVGVAALAAHVLDYAVTLHMSPDLAAEGNPIWRIVIDRFGVGVAKVYGLSGKILLAVLSFELYAWYGVERPRLFPDRATGIVDFWRGFGADAPARWMPVAHFASFAFAALGPFFFYVALLNSQVESAAYLSMPPMPLVLAAYLAGVVGAYFGITYRAFRRAREIGRDPAQSSTGRPRYSA